MSLLDYTFDLLDSAHSPQDFTLVLYFCNPPALEDLRLGAISAMNRYPTSGSNIKKRCWVRNTAAIQIATGSISALDSFVNERFDVRVENPVKQMLLANGAGETCLGPQKGTKSTTEVLATRFHHAAADGLSAAMWLGHQLSVTYRLLAPETVPSAFTELPLRRSTTSVRRSVFAFNGACDALWTTNYIPSGARRWLTINFPAAELQQACRRTRAFTYSDLLATCALEVFVQWNQKHDQGRKIGLWLPMNIRSQFWSGFGNGTSRVRLYAKYPHAASMSDKAREVRRQLSWSTEHGEWVVPEPPLFTRLPRLLVEPLLNGYLKQPSVDMATGVFSHADRWAGDAAEAFKYVTRIECIGLLHPRQHLAINGATHLRETWLTFTYDPALLDAEDVRQLAQMYERQIAIARKELL